MTITHVGASLGPQFDAYSANARAAADDFHGPYNKDHGQHGPHPDFVRAFGGETPCGYTGCKHYDEEFEERRWPVEESPGRVLSINPRTAGLRSSESVLDRHHVSRLLVTGDERNTHGAIPRLAKVPGYEGLHVLDGNHRLLAAHVNGRTINVVLHGG